MREKDENKLKARERKLVRCEEKLIAEAHEISFQVFHLSRHLDCGLLGILHTTSIFRVK
jgi:hypothetical protein